MNPQMLEDDIMNNQPTIEAVRQTALQLIQSTPAKESEAVKSKLETVNRRYSTLSSSVSKHGQDLQTLSSKLNEFERAVDEFEDWLLPDLEKLESKDFMTNDLSNIANTLKVRKQINHLT